MSNNNIPKELKYTESHEWLREESDGSVTIGITKHAQELLGDMVFVELPEIDTDIIACSAAAVIESVKAAADVYSPVSGRITEVNEALVDNPALINTDPYGAGWLYKIKVNDNSEIAELLDPDAYRDQLAND